MSAHLHSSFVEGCYRCDISRDETPEPCVEHDFSLFDRIACPPPCSTMHTLCVACHEAVEPCGLDERAPGYDTPTTETRESAGESES